MQIPSQLELQYIVDELCRKAAVPRALVQMTSHQTPLIWVTASTDGADATIYVDRDWFAAVEGAMLCVCEHGSRGHRPLNSGACAIPGCTCSRFDRSRLNGSLEEESFEAILAHEVGHIYQAASSTRPPADYDAELDADYRAAQLLKTDGHSGHGQLIRALRLTDFLSERQSGSHPLTEVRVDNLRTKFGDERPPEPERPLSRDERVGLLKHLTKLCHDNDITWHKCEAAWTGASGNTQTREIFTPQIDSELDYLAALHEIGHIVLGLETFGPDENTSLFENELAVWAWTFNTTIRPPSQCGRELLMAPSPFPTMVAAIS